MEGEDGRTGATGCGWQGDRWHQADNGAMCVLEAEGRIEGTGRVEWEVTAWHGGEEFDMGPGHQVALL